MKDAVAKIKEWLFPGLLFILIGVATKTFDKVDNMEDKIDHINVIVQELNVKQGYNDKSLEDHNSRIKDLERDHTTVMLKDIPVLKNN